MSDVIKRAYTTDSVGVTEGNIGNLGGMTSPPYASSFHGQQSGIQWQPEWGAERPNSQVVGETGYGNQPGTIGKKEDYWSACAQVYREMYEVLAPGSVAAIVVKDFVKAGKRVNLCDMTLELLVSLGYIPLERTLAMLWDIKPDGTVVERKSFFRRNAEKKGAPHIDWETVIWVGRL